MDAALAESIRNILSGGRVSKNIGTDCLQTVRDRLWMEELFFLCSQQGATTLVDAPEIYAWAKAAFDEDPGCFEFKLWCVVNEKTGASSTTR